jgi:hypothetical protein
LGPFRFNGVWLYTQLMAMPRTWLPRAEEIIDVLRRMKSKQLDRAAIEELFQLQRRAAIELMTQAGAPKAKRGSASLIDRTSLLSWTETIFKDESWQLQRQQETNEELSRSVLEIQAVRAALHQEGRTLIRFPLVEEVLSANCGSLPPGITIAPGCITIQATGEDAATTACQLLYHLATAMANDIEGFAARLSTPESARLLV